MAEEIDYTKEGLINKYRIFKSNGLPLPDSFKGFVLRLDEEGSDPIHREACIKALLTYAKEINEHLPELSRDLIEKYGNNPEEPQSMNIFALKGHQVQVTTKTSTAGYKGDAETVEKNLNLYYPYTIDRTEVSNSSTVVYLMEHPGIAFNSVSFESITNQPSELSRFHPDFQKFN